MTGEEEGEEDMPELPEVMESYQDEKIIGPGGGVGGVEK